MNIIKYLAILLLAFSGSASAEEPAWFMKAIKVDNPNQLAYVFTTSDTCPITKREGEKIVDGIFIRSRIKPLPKLYKPPTVYFNLELHCIKREGDFYTYLLNAYFGYAVPWKPVLYDYPYGTYGGDSKSGISESIKISTEDAVTAFIKANFDL